MTASMSIECPPEIRHLLLEILHFTLIGIRSYAAAHDYKRCEIEANHAHNIPNLIEEFTRGKLEFYLKVEASQYLGEINSEVFSEMHKAWEFFAEWLLEHPD